MHQALYRKWRPQIFDDVCGQDHITSVLKYEIDNAKFSHAYLFCGSRGTGKTTCAKILAKAVNCESLVNGNPCNKCASCRAIDSGAATDVLEMDAASNNGVDNIRDIRDEVVYSPSSLKYRVYIVDEVHMLSSSAFNALLKTLEEPPAHVIFILATTELHKLPATIISRCQRFDFRRITVSDIMARLLHIARQENVVTDNDALRIIAKYSQGGMRDAISLFELCAGNRSSVTANDVVNTIGSISTDIISNLLLAVAKKDYDVIFSIINDIVSSSKEISVFWDDLVAYCRNILIYKTTSAPENYLDLTETEKRQFGEVSSLFTKDTVVYFIKLLNDSLYLMQKSSNTKRYIAEMTLIRMCDESLDYSNEAILSRLSKLESSSVVSRISTPYIENDVVQKEVKEEVTKDSSEYSEPKPVLTTTNITEGQPFAAKPMRGWKNIVEKISESDVIAGPFMKMTKAYVLEDGKISIRFNNDFEIIMVKGSSVPSLLNTLLSEALSRNITSNDIEFVVNDTTISDDSDLDEITQ